MEEVCKICNRAFGCKKALGGHMRVHFMFSKRTVVDKFKNLSNISTAFQQNNINNSDSRLELRDMPSRFTNNANSFSCKLCGKCFVTNRSLSGHMKVHPRKLRILDDDDDLETSKRVKIKHEVTAFYDLNESSSVSSESREVERAAECLVMLSTGVRVDMVTESSDDGSDYYGGANETERSLSSGNVEFGDDLDSKLGTQDETKVGFDACVDLVNRSDNVEKHEWLNGAPVKLHCANDTMESDSTLLTELGEVVSVYADSSSCVKSGARAQNSGLERKYFENAEKTVTGLKTRHISDVDQLKSQKDGVVGIGSLNSSKSKEYKCPVCFKVFSTGQAMGGHKRAHFAKSKSSEETYVKQETEKTNSCIDLNFPIAVEGARDDHQWWVESGNVRTDCHDRSVALSLN